MSEEPAHAGVGRFAPSTTGGPHPGTLLAALLCWLDARSSGARFVVRLEDLDPGRCKPTYAKAIGDALSWLGLDWDERSLQSEASAAHEQALDRLAEAGALYPCACSRSRLRELGVRTPDGGFRYDGHCRERELPSRDQGGWRASTQPLRVRLPAGTVVLRDLGGAEIEQDPLAVFGDPVVRRRDGAVAYHLASVVDDAQAGVTRVVRGRDLAAGTATQVRLQQQLGFETPTYRHHLLLLERRDRKLAKFHGAVALDELVSRYDAAALCGLLACAAGLVEEPRPMTPRALLGDFDWSRVSQQDRLVEWDGRELTLASPETPPET
ncbi:MAG: glutamate--tRNA ligase family protein [Myxococcota bacterium]|jgi:glutamyl-tRNA synthetase/glutamyl-Q tRNA(Asp) synthetase|nr:glutamate--tRNA ligase family protein [Myxococcota bacterium]